MICDLLYTRIKKWTKSVTYFFASSIFPTVDNKEDGEN